MFFFSWCCCSILKAFHFPIFSFSNCNLCTVKLKCMFMKLITVEANRWHKLFSLVSHFQPVCVSPSAFVWCRRCHVGLFFFFFSFWTVWFLDSFHGSDSLAPCTGTMSLINRNPQRKRAAFSLPGYYVSICSVTQPINNLTGCRDINKWITQENIFFSFYYVSYILIYVTQALWERKAVWYFM